MEGLEQRTLLSAFTEFVDPNPSVGNEFGLTVVALSTGNVVITSPYDDAGGENAGAVYLFNGSTGELISTLTGSHAEDNIGIYGVVALSNGNFVVISADWDNGSATDAGAVTWGSGTTGVSGVVSAANSLVGSQAFDRVGIVGVTALTNGNYVVSSPNWANETHSMAGAATWGNGATGTSGAVSQINSLYGTQSGDQVGRYVTALQNGNYVVGSPEWDNETIHDVGAATWANGATGITGIVSSLNSLVGEYESDYVGEGGRVALLSNGHYVVSTPTLDRLVEGNLLTDVGGVTWGNGTTGITGVISLANSLVGSSAGDGVGGNVTALSNGNYVVTSPDWDNFELVPVGYHYGEDVGAVTWGNGVTGTIGLVSDTNSLIGGFFQDQVGIGGVTALSNGHYVVSSPFWDNGGTESGIGAVTWANGVTGLTGVVASSNSLIGSQLNDNIGNGGVTALTNGNYVVVSPYWSHGTISRVGAATFGNGSTGTTGVVGTSNSIYGSNISDRIGGFGVTALSNGHYVVISPEWKNGTAKSAGAVTWGDGISGTSGQVTTSNSLVGSQPNDRVGLVGVTALSNGNYVVSSPDWNGDLGAVTWGNGTTGVTGPVSATNSLVGSSDQDQIGQYGGVHELTNGDYVVSSVAWDNGVVEDAGAATLGSGTAGITGPVSAVNSTIGQSSDSSLQFDVVSDPVNGNYFVRFLNDGGGRVLVLPQLFVPPPPVTFTITGSTLTVTGSADNDTITVLNDAGVIKINANGIIIDTGASAGSVTAVTISGQAGNDMLKLDASLGALVVGTLLGGDGNDTLISSLGNDTLDGGADIDTVSYIQATAGVRVNLSLATVQTTVGAGKDKLLAVENLTGSNWNDTLTGNSGNNILAGGLGNDILNGGLGADSLYGEGDNDSLTIDDSDLIVSGGQGNDKVTVATGSGAINLDLTAGQIETVIATASNVGNAFDASGATWVVSITGGSGNDTIIGGTLNDRLVGGSGDDLISGGDGNDTINGGLGHDTLNGQDGNDSLNGDAGYDDVHGDSGNDLLTIDGDDRNVTGDEGNDKVTVAAGSGFVQLFLVPSAIETVDSSASVGGSLFDALGATWSVSITGGIGRDQILGGNAADKLSGGGGDDIIFGGEGNDTISGGDGNDGLSGNNGDDSITGGDGDDILHGDDGNDLLIGGLGADNLYGDADNDSMTIDGDDVYVFGYGGIDKVIIAAGSGAVELFMDMSWIETVVATASTANNKFIAGGATWAVSIIGGSGNDTIVGGSLNDTLTGGAGDDRIEGSGGNDVLTGGLGADSLDGGEGNDSLMIDNFDTSVVGGAGLDKVTVSGATGGVTLDLTGGEIETVLASASTYANHFDATGATWAVSVIGGSGNDTIVGGSLNDTLTGGAGDDQIEGQGGNDLLTGGLGGDSLDGGEGNDSLTIDNFDTSVVGGAGLDKVTVSGATGGVTLDLTGGEIETVLASASTYANLFDATGATWAVNITGGSGNDSIIGGNLNDTLTGGAGDDSLSGGHGNDALTGGLGADKLFGDGGNDALKFDNLDTSVVGGAGLDTATVTTPTGAVSLNLFTGEIETVSATASTFHNLFDATGATWAVVITGGSGNDTILGGLMNDKLTGGAGNDLLIGAEGNDTLTGGDGIDTISYSTASGSVNVNLTTKKTTGAAGNDALSTIENVIGSPFADTITGDLLNNILNGGDLIVGNDTILGGGGVDSIINA